MRTLFLDRDGVVNIETGYVATPDRFRFRAGFFGLGRRALAAGWQLVVVTNQGGIGLGLYSEAQFHALTRWMCDRLANEQIQLLDVYHSPFHPEAVTDALRGDSPCRKPNPGMIVRAAQTHGIDLARSAMVGDRDSDMLAAERAGISRRWFMTGPETANQAPPPDCVVVDSFDRLAQLLEA